MDDELKKKREQKTATAGFDNEAMLTAWVRFLGELAKDRDGLVQEMSARLADGRTIRLTIES